jgi:hypothetical protein
MKAVIAEVMLHQYPDHTLTFEIYTDILPVGHSHDAKWQAAILY